MLTIQSGTISLCHNYLDKIGKINQQSVQSLPMEVKEFLREITPLRIKELAQMNCFAAEKIKNKLDKKYGENNYVLIAIGRSVSSIAELMGKNGVDTKIIPLSGLRKCEVNDIPKKALKVYKNFLAQIGLSKTDLSKNKDKKYILIDYAYYGRSLKRAEELLKTDEIFGDTTNLLSLSVNDILEEDFNQRGFRTLFQFNRFKDYSYVGKLNAENLEQVYKQCVPERIKEFSGNITQGLRKLFWFNVFDSLNQNNYKNIVPKKELNALYNHQLSPKATQNYIKREFEKENKIIKSYKI